MDIGKSSVRKFLICHEAEYIEGDDSCLKSLPITPVLPIKGSSNFVSAYAYETYLAEYVELLVAKKMQLTVEAICVGEDNLDNLNDAIMSKIFKYGTRYFYFNFYHPSVGWYFSRVYIGTPIETEAEYISNTDGSDTVTKIKFNIIETSGIKIPSTN